MVVVVDPSLKLSRDDAEEDDGGGSGGRGSAEDDPFRRSIRTMMITTAMKTTKATINPMQSVRSDVDVAVGDGRAVGVGDGSVPYRTIEFSPAGNVAEKATLNKHVT